jgi:ABC-type glycerol-3-phosphate transport system substrate-binding protein
MAGLQRLVFVGLAIALAMAGAGCRERDDTAAIRFQTLARPPSPDRPASAEYRLLEAMIAEFHKQHPEIRVVLTGKRQRMEYLMRSVIARQAADVIEIRAGEVEYLGGRAAIQPLTAYYVDLRDQCEPWAWERGYVGQQLHALPWSMRPKLLLYNKDAFRAAGLAADKPPKTWDDLVRTAKSVLSGTALDPSRPRAGFAMAARNSADFGRHFATFVAQLGEPLVRWGRERDQGRWSFSARHKDGERVLGLLKQLQRHMPAECVVSDDADTVRQFRSGQAAMVIAGPEALGPGAEEDPKFEIGVAALPAPRDMGTSCDVETRFLTISASVSGARAESARTFLGFMLSRAAQDIVARGVDGSRPVLPVRHDLLRGPSFQNDPQLGPFARSVGHRAPVLPWFLWEGKCAKDWITEAHSWMLDDRRGATAIIDVAYGQGNRAISCVYTDIGHPSVTVTLGMCVVALAVFAVVAYTVARH